MRMFGWKQHGFHDWVISENRRAYSLDVAVCYVAAMEIVDPFDHVYKLWAKKLKGEPIVDTWEYSSLPGATD